MSNDDGWFKQVLYEADSGETDAGDTDPEESERRNDGEIDVDDTDSSSAAESDAPDSSATGGVEFGIESEEAGAAGERDEPLSSGDSPFGDSTDGDSYDDDPLDGDGDPFSTDFATTFSNASIPDTGGGFGSNSSNDNFGFGPAPGSGPRGSDSPTFDDEEFGSDIDRVDISIKGFDSMILGGVPKRSLMVAIGSVGTGKTTFELQFLRKAFRDGGSSVYVTPKESRERILDTADKKGWEFLTYETDGQLAVIDLDPVEMASSLSGIRNGLPRLIEESGADRLVLDSVSLLEMMYNHLSKRHSEVFNFTRSLKDADVTAMLTSEADQSTPYVSRHGIVEYLSDTVFILQYIYGDGFRETRLAIEIQEIRDASHSWETKPYELTNEGVNICQQTNIF